MFVIKLSQDPLPYGVTQPTYDAFLDLDECVPRRKMTLAQVKLHHAQAAMRFTGSNISESARMLGIHRRQLQRILRRA